MKPFVLGFKIAVGISLVGAILKALTPAPAFRQTVTEKYWFKAEGSAT